MTKINYLLALLIIALFVSFTNLFSLANGKNITSNQETNLNSLIAGKNKEWVEEKLVELVRLITGEKPIPPQRAPFCTIFPALDSEIYDRTTKKQPVFIWSGDDFVYKIKIQNNQTEEILPVHLLTEEEKNRRTVIYPTILSSGKYTIIYYLRSDKNNNSSEWTKGDYYEQRNFLIKNENLEIPNFDNSELTPEEIAWEKANYYFSKKYYAEAIQEVFSVQTPSDEEQYEKQLKEAGKIACRKE